MPSLLRKKSKEDKPEDRQIISLKFAQSVIDDVFDTVFALDKTKEFARAVIDDIFAQVISTISTTKAGKRNSTKKSSIQRISSNSSFDRKTLKHAPSGSLTNEEIKDLYNFLGTHETTPEEKALAARRVIWGRKVATRAAHLSRNLHNQTPSRDLVVVPGFLDELNHLWYQNAQKRMIRVPRREQRPGEKPTGVMREFKKLKLLVEEQTEVVWYAQPWYFNVFHKPWSCVKLLSSDSDIHPDGIGSSELSVLKIHVQSGRVRPQDCAVGSYNFYDRPTVGWRKHWTADVLTNCLYCKKIGV